MAKSLRDCPKPDVVMYHHPCPDGTACEIQARELWPDAVFAPYTHGSAQKLLSDEKLLTGKTMYCLDWCPVADQLLNLSKMLAHLIAIDHHPTSADTVSELDRKQAMPANVTLFLSRSEQGTCAALMLFRLVHGDDGEIKEIKEVKVPDWLTVINLHDTGQFDLMSAEDVCYHTGLTDEIKHIAALRHEPREKIEKLGRDLLEKREKIAKQLCEKVEFEDVLIKGAVYRVAYVDIPGDKLVKHVADALFATTTAAGRGQVSFAAMRLLVARSTTTDFKLRRPPGSALDLARLARCYPCGGGHVAAAGIQLPGVRRSPTAELEPVKFLYDVL